MSLREDIICEKMRSPQEIRNFLAKHLRMVRHKPSDELYREQIGFVLALRWVLQHDKSYRHYYREKYCREWPE